MFTEGRSEWLTALCKQDAAGEKKVGPVWRWAPPPLRAAASVPLHVLSSPVRTAGQRGSQPGSAPPALLLTELSTDFPGGNSLF